MAKCDIQVILDEPQRVYLPGETVTGKVYVETDAECRCDSLDVVLQERAFGKGNSRSHALEKSQEFVGKWAAQSRHEYPFSFRVPDEARPYHGTLLNVVYEVHARADIPWAIDPKASATVTVSYPNEGALQYAWDEEKVKKGANPGCFYVPLLLLLGGAAWMAFGLVAEPSAVPIACVPLTIGFFGVLIFGRKWLAEQRLGSIQLGFEMGSGGGYRVAEDADAFFVIVRTGSGKSITGVTSELKVYEQVVRGSGSNRRSYSHPLFESSVTLEQSAEGVYRGRMTLPAQGECPPTITLPDNRIIWKVSTRVDIPNWPDWTQKAELDVTPKRERPLS